MAASPSARACTPPPSLARTPHAPRLGWEDDWPARRSSRVASRKESSKRAADQVDDSEPSNAALSSPRKRTVAPDRVDRAPGSASKPTGDHSKSKVSRSQLLSAQTGMLPTPSKTPSQKDDKKSAVNVQHIARTLFAVPEDELLMPSPKKQSKSYSALESFVAEDDDEFPIHVDSKERVPERDQSTDNPFDDSYVRDSTTKKKRSAKKVVIPGEGVVAVEKAVGRDDGLLMNFRGRTRFHKHAEAEETNEDSFRPPVKAVARRLFAAKAEKKEKTKAEIEEEEAETDVEDNADEEEEVPQAEIRIEVEEVEEVEEVKEVEIKEKEKEKEPPATPRAQKKKTMPSTPEAPHFGIGTPPDTRRVTRSTAKALDKTPSKSPSASSSSGGGGRLAFADFRVTKNKSKDLVHDTKPSTRKRVADQLSAPATKRART